MRHYKLIKVWEKPNRTIEIDFDLFTNSILNFSIEKSNVYSGKKSLGCDWRIDFLKFSLKHYYHPF